MRLTMYKLFYEKIYTIFRNYIYYSVHQLWSKRTVKHICQFCTAAIANLRAAILPW